MESSLVSIIVPVYNTAEYVEECILSILSQSYKNIELILVNDGSTDGSGNVCKKYLYLSNVYYIEQDHMGPTATRKRGIEETHGDWIMFVDSDDVITKEAVNIFLSSLDGVDIVVGRISDNGTVYPPIMTREEYIFMMYAKRVSSSPCAKLFRKSLFNENTLCFTRKVCRWEDWLMNLQIAKDNKTPVKTILEKVYYYRMRPNSTSHTNVLSFNELEHLCCIADKIVSEVLTPSTFIMAKIENRLKLFYHELLLNGFHNDPNHPFIIDIKHCMGEAGVWRPMDRWLLSVSSPMGVKTVWNLRRVTMRLAHPSMIVSDMKKLAKFFACFLLVSGNLCIFAATLAI